MSNEQYKKLLDAYREIQPEDNSAPELFRQNLAHLVTEIVKFQPNLKDELPPPEDVCDAEKFNQRQLTQLYLRLELFLR